MNKSSVLILVFVLAAQFICGCAALNRQPAVSRLTDKYMEAGNRLEQANKLVDAKKNYLLALTVEPEHQAAMSRLQTVNGLLLSRAQEHYDKSFLLLKNGKYEDANQHLRIALRLWPEHEQARRDLVDGQYVQIQDFIWHTIQKGEYLSLIAREYYGSMKPTSQIAKVNQIKDAAKVREGMKLKIPHLEKFPFVKSVIQKNEQIAQQAVQIEVIEAEISPVKMYKDLGIEFFESKKYENAIAEFKKVLSSDPVDKDAAGFIFNAYTHLGTAAFNNRRYLNAIGYYQNALDHDKACSACKNQIQKSQNLYNEHHYKAGMKFFDAQKLTRAISEWNLVYQMAPDYKRVTELLEKAKTIQKNINVIKQNQ